MDSALDLMPDELEVKGYQLIPNENDPAIYELDMDVITMNKAEYAVKAKAQFSGVDYSYG